MRGFVMSAVLAAGVFGAAPAWANMCKAEKLSCATQMPVGGYCECTSKGTTESGTVEAGGMKRTTTKPTNATAGGCGADPKAPGCR